MGLNLRLPIPTVYYKSRGLGRAKPWPSRSRDPRLGLEFQKAGAALGWAKAAAFRPSRAGTALTEFLKVRQGPSDRYFTQFVLCFYVCV